MTGRFPIRAVAGCFALAGFAVAVLSGLAAERAADDILLTAIISMFICQWVGTAAAMVAGVALRERIVAHRAESDSRITEIGQSAKHAGATSAAA